MSRGLPLLLCALCVGAGACAGPGDDGPVAPLELHAADLVDASGEGRLDLTGVRAREIIVHLDGEARILELAVTGAPATLDGEQPGAMGWFAPRPVTAAQVSVLVAGEAAADVTLWIRGAPAPAVQRDRSLIWRDPSIVDDPSIVGLGTVLAAAADDGHGGLLLDRWFRRFATTIHSERTAPSSLMDETAAAQGADPTAWDVDALPFLVTAVHNRIDLAARSGGCGELRVSFASTHAVYAPLHLIFLFRQVPDPDADVAPDGTIHCLGTARRWARLSALEGAELAAAARAWLSAAIRHDTFLLAESVELTVSPWEWRQWTRVGVDEFDNPPLFQTVDVAALNAPGPRRDDFLAFVATNATALAERTIELPDRFRAASARVPPGAPRPTLDLGPGVDPALLEPIEIVGCPACHTTNADFIQTTVERELSPFYDLELDAREARLELMTAGELPPVPPFGPLQ